MLRWYPLPSYAVMCTHLRPLRNLPWRRWPLLAQIVTVMASGFSIGTLLVLINARMDSELRVQQARHKDLTAQVNAPKSIQTDLDSIAFLDTLASQTQLDDLVRDIGRFANVAGVEIGSFTLSRKASTMTQIASLQFKIVAKGSYRGVKDWLAQLLSRYHSLAVMNLTLQVNATEPGVEEVQLTLVWYVRE